MHRWIVRVAAAALTTVGLGSTARSATSPSLAALVAAFKHDAGCAPMTHDAVLVEAPLRPLGQRLDLSTERMATKMVTTPLVIPVSFEARIDNPLRSSNAGGGDSAPRNPLR